MHLGKATIGAIFFGLIVAQFGGHASWAGDATSEARWMFRRLTGQTLVSVHPKYPEIITLVEKGQIREAAAIAVEEPGFLTATVRQWASMIMSSGTKPMQPLNDTLATFIGSVRDNLDARELVTGDYIYGSDPRLGFSKPKPNSNTLFDAIDQSSKDLKITLKRYTPQWDVSDLPEAAGVLTTRGYAALFYSAGTNRRAVVGAMDWFMCRPIDRWKTPYLSTARIRQDVDRNPPSGPRTFQTECRSCHGAMDALAGAFAHYDFANDGIRYLTAVQPKYFLHSDVYPEGFVTQNDSWINLLTGTRHASFGWRGDTQGNGPRELGEMIAESEGFGACMTMRVFDQLCDQKLDIDHATIREIAKSFEEDDKYRLKDLFTRVISHEECHSGKKRVAAVVGKTAVNSMDQACAVRREE